MMDYRAVLGREIPPVGEGSFYIVGEAPGRSEDRAGVPFIGSSGNLLFRALGSLGLHRSQTRIANTFWRRPPSNDLSKLRNLPEFVAYRQKLLADIFARKPKIILALGKYALETFFPEEKLEEIRGYWLDWNGIPFLATYHPARVLRENSLLPIFYSDLKKAVRRWAGLELPLKKEELLMKLGSPDALAFYLREILQNPARTPFALDIETSLSDISLIGIALETEEGLVAVNAPPTEHTKELLRQILASPDANPILHNAGFDLSWLYGAYGIEPVAQPHDTMLMHHLLYPQLPKSLRFCASFYLNVEAWKGLAEQDLLTYNALDCINTLLLWSSLKSELKREGIWEVYDLQKRREILPATFMGLLGARIDEAEKQRVYIELTSEAERLRARIDELLPEARGLNLRSHSQLKDLLYKRLRLKPVTKKGKITSDADAVRQLASRARETHIREGLKLYLEWRSKLDIISKELSVQNHPWTGCIHTSYSVYGTETARWSSSAPAWSRGITGRKNEIVGGANFQNRSKPYRSFYLPRWEDFIFISADYSGAEARIVAWRCNDQASKEAFLQGVDIHRLTAAMMFSKPLDEVSPSERKLGKMIRHASNYDMSWRKLSQKLLISASEAKDLLARYHASFPAIRQVFHARTKELVEKERKLLDAWGYPTFFRSRIDADALRFAYAFYPQSTCTHTLNRALLRIWERTKDDPDIALQFQIHDELVLLVRRSPSAIRRAFDLLEEEMLEEIPILDLSDGKIKPLVLPIEFSVGKSWSMEEFKTREEAESFALSLIQD